MLPLPQQTAPGTPQRLYQHRVPAGEVGAATLHGGVNRSPRTYPRWPRIAKQGSNRQASPLQESVPLSASGETLTENPESARTPARSYRAPGPANQSDQQVEKRNTDQARLTGHPSFGSWNVMPAVSRKQVSRPFLGSYTRSRVSGSRA